MPVTYHYQVQYGICSLLFLLAVTMRFFSMRRFPSRTNRIFGLGLLVAIGDLTLDIASSYTIMLADRIPPAINYIVNSLFYSLQIILPVVLLTYILYAAGRSYRNRKLLLLLLPAVCFLLLTCLNLWTGLLFSIRTVNGVRAYCRGPLFPLLFVETAFYFIEMICMLFFYQRDLERRQRLSIFWLFAILSLFMALQYRLPSLLLTGMAISLGFLLLFFTLQNPNDMLDLVCGVFNDRAMNTFLDSTVSQGERLWLIAVDIGGLRRINDMLGLSTGNHILAQTGAFFNQLGKDMWVFRMFGTRFLLATTKKEVFLHALHQTKQRFQEPWVLSENTVLLSAVIRYYDDDARFHTVEEVIHLISSAYDARESNDPAFCVRIGGDFLQRIRRQGLVEDAVREALRKESGFSLVFQPIYDVSSGTFHCAETLLRLNSPMLGQISPSEFIPLAEKAA